MRWKSIPPQVTYVDSHTQCGKFSQVSTVIPLGHADPLDLVLAHTGAHRILREPTTLVDGWDLILGRITFLQNAGTVRMVYPSFVRRA